MPRDNTTRALIPSPFALGVGVMIAAVVSPDLARATCMKTSDGCHVCCAGGGDCYTVCPDKVAVEVAASAAGSLGASNDSGDGSDGGDPTIGPRISVGAHVQRADSS